MPTDDRPAEQRRDGREGAGRPQHGPLPLSDAREIGDRQANDRPERNRAAPRGRGRRRTKACRSQRARCLRHGRRASRRRRAPGAVSGRRHRGGGAVRGRRRTHLQREGRRRGTRAARSTRAHRGGRARASARGRARTRETWLRRMPPECRSQRRARRVGGTPYRSAEGPPRAQGSTLLAGGEDAGRWWLGNRPEATQISNPE